jgi:hypothetical protein
LPTSFDIPKIGLPVSTLVAVTFTPDMTAPEGSVIVPLMVATSTCAAIGNAVQARIASK